MSFARAAINALITQELGERMCFNAWLANGLVKGDTWGALMPTYDGHEFLDRKPRDDVRPFWPSSVDRVRNQVALEALPARGVVRWTFAPATWREPVVYETEPPAVVDVEARVFAINPQILGPQHANPPSL